MKQQGFPELMGRDDRRDLRSGQAIILIALAAIILVAIMGIAIDGGRLLFERRNAQNATDAAVLAATYSLCTGGTSAEITEAGLAAAAENGVSPDENTIVEIIPNPVIPEYTDDPDSDFCAECSVQVKVDRAIDPYFIQIVYSGQLEISTEAIGSCNPNSQIEDDGSTDDSGPPLTAIYGGSTTCSNTVSFTGANGDVVGGIHSNNMIQGGGSDQNVYGPSSEVTGLQGGADKIDWAPIEEAPLLNQQLVCGADAGCFDDDDDDSGTQPEHLDGPYTDNGEPDYPLDHDIADFRPGGAIASAAGHYVAFMQSGKKCDDGNGNTSNTVGWDFLEQYATQDPGTGVWTLQSGIYYSECDFALTSNITARGDVTFVTEEGISWSNGTWYVRPYTAGLLVFANNTSGAKCNGNGVHFSLAGTWEGNIFAPRGEIQFSSSSTTVNGCLVGYTVNMSNAAADVVCNPPNLRDTVSITK